MQGLLRKCKTNKKILSECFLEEYYRVIFIGIIAKELLEKSILKAIALILN